MRGKKSQGGDNPSKEGSCCNQRRRFLVFFFSPHNQELWPLLKQKINELINEKAQESRNTNTQNPKKKEETHKVGGNRSYFSIFVSHASLAPLFCYYFFLFFSFLAKKLFSVVGTLFDPTVVSRSWWKIHTESFKNGEGVEGNVIIFDWSFLGSDSAHHASLLCHFVHVLET